MKNMKNLKKIILTSCIAGNFLIGNKGLMAQSAKENSIIYPDSLCIEIKNYNLGEINQRMHASGYRDSKWVVFFGCNYYNKDKSNYNSRMIHWGGQNNIQEEFKIDYGGGLIDYRIYLINPYKEIINFKNLTKEQIFQDKESAERTKKIINACESEENLKKIIKEIYKEKNTIYIPQIKQ